jgi:3-hydroxybutyryl-CoA dehydrogenase
MKIQKVFVAGSGTMGRGIAQACAQAGLAVIINDISQAALDAAVKQISWSAGKLIEKGKVSGTLDEVMAGVSTSITLEPAAECDMVVEAIFEDVAVKRVFFTDLDKVVGISCWWPPTPAPFPSPSWHPSCALPNGFWDFTSSTLCP